MGPDPTPKSRPIAEAAAHQQARQRLPADAIGTANGIHDASWSEGSALSVNYASSEEVDVRLAHHCSGPAKPNI
jgi:hypothetical protein